MTDRTVRSRWLLHSSLVFSCASIAFAIPSLGHAMGERKVTLGTRKSQIQAAGPKVFKAKGANRPEVSRDTKAHGSGVKVMELDYAKASDQLTKAGGKVVVMTPTNRYIKLTPGIPHISGKGYVNFLSSYLVDTNEGFVSFIPSANPPTLVLSVWSPANKKYGIDLVLSTDADEAGGGSTRGFSIALGGTTVDIERVKGGAQHIVFELDATSEGWYTFQFKNTGGAFSWAFLSCDILNL